MKKTFATSIFESQSDEAVIKVYKHMERIFTKMSHDHPNYVKYRARFEGVMLYMVERFGEDRFCEIAE